MFRILRAFIIEEQKIVKKVLAEKRAAEKLARKEKLTAAAKLKAKVRMYPLWNPWVAARLRNPKAKDQKWALSNLAGRLNLAHWLE